jgi:hypothetical protein
MVSSVTSVLIYCYCFFLSLHMNQVPEKLYEVHDLITLKLFDHLYYYSKSHSCRIKNNKQKQKKTEVKPDTPKWFTSCPTDNTHRQVSNLHVMM